MVLQPIVIPLYLHHVSNEATCKKNWRVTQNKMKTEIVKRIYDGREFNILGSFDSLESAHAEHRNYDYQQTWEDIDAMSSTILYLHLMEFRDDEHVNDLYFTIEEFN